MRRIGIAVAALALLAAVCARLALPAWIAGRIRSALEGRPGVTGEFEDVEVCVSCGRYRIVAPEVRSGGGNGEPFFEATHVDVRVLVGGNGRWLRGRIELAAPVLRATSGGEDEATGLDVAWRAIGSALSPVDVDEVEARDGRLIVTNPSLFPEVAWRFASLHLVAQGLAGPPDQRARVDVDARVFASGSLDAEAEIARGRGGAFHVEAPFHVEARLDDVPLSKRSHYFVAAAGVDVESGTLSGALDGDGREGRFEGELRATLTGLDVLSWRDVTDSNPLHLLWETLIGAVATGADLSKVGEGLDLHLAISESLASPEVDAGTVLASLVWRALLAPLTRPLDTLRHLFSGEVTTSSEE